jgi:hypothetical protein
MSDVCIFLNTRVENSGTLAWIGDKGLAPYRYLFNGKTMQVQPRDSDKVIEIHHVEAFHEDGDWNYSKSNGLLRSESTGMIKTILSIVLLVPGIIVGIVFKVLAYLSSDIREKHSLVKEHFTPINRVIGSVANPIKTRHELHEAIAAERKSDPKNHRTDAMIIHGDGNLTINEDPGILAFNPMKLILDGVKIVHEPAMGDRLDDKMLFSGKWKVGPRMITNDPSIAGAKVQQAKSIDDALRYEAPKRSWTSCKRYHTIIEMAKA